ELRGAVRAAATQSGRAAPVLVDSAQPVSGGWALGMGHAFAVIARLSFGDGSGDPAGPPTGRLARMGVDGWAERSFAARADARRGSQAVYPGSLVHGAGLPCGRVALARRRDKPASDSLGVARAGSGVPLGFLSEHFCSG